MQESLKRAFVTGLVSISTIPFFLVMMCVQMSSSDDSALNNTNNSSNSSRLATTSSASNLLSLNFAQLKNRLKATHGELRRINTSLSALSNCVAALGEVRNATVRVST